MPSLLTELIKLLNENQGAVSVLLFIVALLIGWVTGIFEALRRKPKLTLGLIPGPTLCTTFNTDKKSNGYEVHRTAISLYLKIANTGTSATSIKNVALGYHWHLRPYSWIWLRRRVMFWTWIEHAFHTLDDFQVTLSDGSLKVYPSLFQRSWMLGKVTDTYLEPGREVNGVVYFEIDESWGGHFPARLGERTRLRVAVEDVFGTKHKKSFWVPVVTLAEAQKFNPAFGQSLATARHHSDSGKRETTA